MPAGKQPVTPYETQNQYIFIQIVIMLEYSHIHRLVAQQAGNPVFESPGTWR